MPIPGKSSTPGLCAKLRGFSSPCGGALAGRSASRTGTPVPLYHPPAIANERLKRNRAGQVVLQLKSPYKDGTTHIVMSPLEFMQRLAALVPRPRLHLIRFHGVLAPNAKLRLKSFPVRQSLQPSPQPMTLTRRARRRA